MKNKKGRYVQLPDGRKGIYYNGNNTPDGRVIINLVDKDFNFINNDKGKPKIVFKLPSNISVIAYID